MALDLNVDHGFERINGELICCYMNVSSCDGGYPCLYDNGTIFARETKVPILENVSIVGWYDADHVSVFAYSA